MVQSSEIFFGNPGCGTIKISQRNKQTQGEQVVLINYQLYRVGVVHGDTREYTSVHNSGVTLSKELGALFTNHSVNAA